MVYIRALRSRASSITTAIAALAVLLLLVGTALAARHLAVATRAAPAASGKHVALARASRGPGGGGFEPLAQWGATGARLGEIELRQYTNGTATFSYVVTSCGPNTSSDFKVAIAKGSWADGTFTVNTTYEAVDPTYAGVGTMSLTGRFERRTRFVGTLTIVVPHDVFQNEELVTAACGETLHFSGRCIRFCENNYVGTGACEVPALARPGTFAGFTLGEARAILRRFRCSLGRVSTRRAGRSNRGRVIAQSIPAWRHLRRGARVGVTVGR